MATLKTLNRRLVGQHCTGCVLNVLVFEFRCPFGDHCRACLCVFGHKRPSTSPLNNGISPRVVRGPRACSRCWWLRSNTCRSPPRTTCLARALLLTERMVRRVTVLCRLIADQPVRSHVMSSSSAVWFGVADVPYLHLVDLLPISEDALRGYLH